MSEHAINIIGRMDTEDRAPLGRIGEWRYTQQAVSTERIKSALTDFLSSMREILDGLPDQMESYMLESMDISLEISSKGNISLVGIGGEVGGKGGLTLHLKKKSPSEKIN